MAGARKFIVHWLITTGAVTAALVLVGITTAVVIAGIMLLQVGNLWGIPVLIGAALLLGLVITLGDALLERL